MMRRIASITKYPVKQASCIGYINRKYHNDKPNGFIPKTLITGTCFVFVFICWSMAFVNRFDSHRLPILSTESADPYWIVYFCLIAKLRLCFEFIASSVFYTLISCQWESIKKKRILFFEKKKIQLGGLGQLGIECAKLLRSKYGNENVILSDIIKPNKATVDSGPYIFADILDFKVGPPNLYCNWKDT